MKLSKREALNKCLHMWDWLADHPEKDKQDFFIEKNLEFVDSDCYCCEYDIQFSGDACEYCPIDWDSDDGFCSHELDDEQSAYDKWFTAQCQTQKRSHALAIAKLAEEALDRLNDDEGE